MPVPQALTSASTSIFQSTGPTSAYPKHYFGPLLLGSSCSPWLADGFLLGWAESVRGVTSFRVSILCDRRSILYAGVVLSGYCLRFDHAASTLALLSPAPRSGFYSPDRRWQVVLHDASSISSFIINPSHLLDKVTAFGSPLIAFSPLLLTVDNQSLVMG